MSKDIPSNLAQKLIDLWAQQGRDGFLLSELSAARTDTRQCLDPECDISFRFRWLPHREIRGDVAELQRRGILNPDRDESSLFRDPRDPSGRHCFLCRENIKQCHPLEVLYPLNLAGREYLAGANFAWIEPDHFTVMAAEHIDQTYSRHVLEAAIDLHRQTNGQFRVLFNGTGAGATIPWHLHLQITTEPMPVELLSPQKEHLYPTVVCRFDLSNAATIDNAHRCADSWLSEDAENRSINLLVATPNGQTTVFIFPRDKRYAQAPGKGLIGGFEVAGDFVLSAPAELETFKNSSAQTARDILTHISPPDWNPAAKP